MHAYYFDNVPGDRRLPHDSGRPVLSEKLNSIGIWSRKFPVDGDGRWETQIDEVAKERGYKNRDTINITREGLGDLYDVKIKMFFEE